jgi:peptidoglycan/xylan/chitin deacetylase (PgdA/CDA1 family)
MSNVKTLAKSAFLFFIFSLVLFAPKGASVFAQSATTSVNLISNPSLETQSGKLPQSWSKGISGLRNTVVFTYPVAGFNSQKAAKVEITKYSLGDAKWYPNYISVVAGSTYYFSDNYLSNTTSSIVIAYKMASGTYKYVQIAILPAATGWKSAQKTFTVPAGAKSMTVFHLLSSVGQLTVDNYYLINSVLGAVAPYVDIISPKNGETVSNTIQLIADTGKSADIAGVQFMIDGADVGSEATSTPYQISFNTAVLTGGSHTISARARDKFGTKITSNPVFVNVFTDSTAPVVSLLNLIKGQIFSGTVNLSATATDNIGVVGVQFIVDGTDFGKEVTVAPYQTSFNTSAITSGSAIISARARDAAGNKSVSAEIPVIILNFGAGTGAGSSGGQQSQENLIKNPSLEIADSLGDSPLYWNRGGYGDNLAFFTYPVLGHDSEKAGKIEITQYSGGDAKWYFDDVPVTPGATYEFVDYYISNIQSTVTYRFTLSNGSTTYDDIAYLGSSSAWQRVAKTFQAPANAVSVTVFHIISSIGSLTVDDFSLVEVPVVGILSQGIVSLEFDDGWLSTYQNAIPILNAAGFKSTQYIISGSLGNTDDGYMSASNVLAMQSAGHEIGVHSRTHAHLTTLSPADLESEVAGSKQDLLDIGVSQVLSFAYPYGETNSTVIAAVKNAGYAGARGIEFGLNNKTTDHYNLLAKPVELSTNLDTVKAWIDDAILNKKWLILFFHQIDNSGELYSTTPQTLQQIVNYLFSNSVSVVTNSEGIQALSQP